MGRAAASRRGIDFFWSASGFEANVKASELWARLYSDYSVFEIWISVWVNGVQTARLMLNKGMNDICLFRNLDARKKKNVRVYKETQAMGDDSRHRFFLKSFLTDGEFLDAPPQPLKIEFIGDSITSGEGAVGAKSETDWTSIFFGATKTYAFKLAQKLGADFSVISQSGWGVVCGYDCNFDHAIPKHYEEICSVMKGGSKKIFAKPASESARLAKQKWDFSNFQPDYVIVNLGTNDQNPCETRADILKMFEPAVIDFLKKIRARNPKAQIVWCYGMMGRSLSANLERAVNDYKKQSGDERVRFVLLPQIDVKNAGAFNHPSEAQHKKTADFLMKEFEQSLQARRS